MFCGAKRIKKIEILRSIFCCHPNRYALGFFNHYLERTHTERAKRKKRNLLAGDFCCVFGLAGSQFAIFFKCGPGLR